MKQLKTLRSLLKSALLRLDRCVMLTIYTLLNFHFCFAQNVDPSILLNSYYQTLSELQKGVCGITFHKFNLDGSKFVPVYGLPLIGFEFEAGGFHSSAYLVQTGYVYKAACLTTAEVPSIAVVKTQLQADWFNMKFKYLEKCRFVSSSTIDKVYINLFSTINGQIGFIDKANQFSRSVTVEGIEPNLKPPTDHSGTHNIMLSDIQSGRVTNTARVANISEAGIVIYPSSAIVSSVPGTVCDLDVYITIKPTNESTNEKTFISCIGCYPLTKIKIYNGRGPLVFKRSNYNNKDHSFKVYS